MVGTLPTAEEAARGPFELATTGELTVVSAEISRAAMDGPFTSRSPARADGGSRWKRVEYIYSPTERNEHIYLNRALHVALPPGHREGLADTDRCHYLKVGDELYLFVWREKIVPTLGAVSWTRGEAMGKIFGHVQRLRRGLHDISAGAALLNVTSHVMPATIETSLNSLGGGVLTVQIVV